MTIAKVIEVMAEGENIEAAIQTSVTEAADTEQGIKHVYVEGIQAIVEDDMVMKYRVNPSSHSSSKQIESEKPGRVKFFLR